MSSVTDQAADLNRNAWDSLRRQRDEGFVNIRPDSAAAILAGRRFLYAENLELVGDVRGKRLLDMGCGDGAEMLEWARAGAIVTGVDNSLVQLEAARRNADKLGVECRLVQADLLRLPEDLLRGEFDVVFSAWVQAWIGDLDVVVRQRVARSEAGRSLSPKRRSPRVTKYVQQVEEGEPLRDSYFDVGPYYLVESPDDPWNLPVDPAEPLTTIEWGHTLGSLVTAVARGRAPHRRPAGAAGHRRDSLGLRRRVRGQWTPGPDHPGRYQDHRRLRMAMDAPGKIRITRNAFRPAAARLPRSAISMAVPRRWPWPCCWLDARRRRLRQGRRTRRCRPPLPPRLRRTAALTATPSSHAYAPVAIAHGRSDPDRPAHAN